MEPNLSFPSNQIVRLVFKRSVQGTFHSELFYRAFTPNGSHITHIPQLNHSVESYEQTFYIDGIKRKVSSGLHNMLEARYKLGSENETLYFNARAFYMNVFLGYAVYAPLSNGNSIRLLSIERHDTELVNETPRLVFCQLVEVELSSNPIYQAISYEWGNPSANKVLIYVNCQPRMVRTNLFYALRRFQQREKQVPDDPLRIESPRYLWVDALCINQQNISERNHQVQLMGEIYRHATDVLIWLGHSPPGYDAQFVFSILERLPDLQANMPNSEILRKKFFDDFAGLWSFTKTPKAIAGLLNWGYWRRMWIIQEIQLALNLHIYCGEAHMPWSALTKVRQYLSEDNSAETEFRSSHELKWIRESFAFRFDEYRQKGFQRALKDWLLLSAESECANRRDKVYALLGMSTDTRGLLVANYSKPIITLYDEVMRMYSPYRGLGHRCFVNEMGTLSKLLHKALQLNRPGSTFSNDERDAGIVWVAGMILGTIAGVEHEARSISKVEQPVIDWPKWFNGADSFHIIHQSTANTCSIPVKVISIDANIFAEGNSESNDLGVYRPVGRTRTTVFHVGRYKTRGHTVGKCQIGDFIFGFPNSFVALIFRIDKNNTERLLFVGEAVVDHDSSMTDEEIAVFWKDCPGNPTETTRLAEDTFYLRLKLKNLRLIPNQDMEMFNTDC